MGEDYFLDLRSFGAIGFQDKSGEPGLWLGFQGYRPQGSLLARVVEGAIRRNVDVVAITTEDDIVLPDFPEDRFGFLAHPTRMYDKGYVRKRVGDNILEVTHEGRTVYLVNARTYSGDDSWHGLKLQVIGTNSALGQGAMTFKQTAMAARKRGLVTIVMNVGASDEAKRCSAEALHDFDAVVTYDASHCFTPSNRPLWAMASSRLVPAKLRAPSMGPYSPKADERAAQYAQLNRKPGIAIGSGHWMHEIGTAGITVPRSMLPLDKGDQMFLNALRSALEKGDFKNVENRNKPSDVWQFMKAIREWGRGLDRFKGTLSSYNKR